jgi:hypothetical protein
MSDESNVIQFRRPAAPAEEGATCVDVDGEEAYGLLVWLSSMSDGKAARIGITPAPEGCGWALDADAAERLGQRAADLSEEQNK